MTVTRTHTYPEGTAPGVYTITATDGVNTAQAQITILDSTPNTVTVDPTTVAPGGTVTVTGTGFPATTGGSIEILPAGGGAAVGTATFTTDGTGAVPPTDVTVDGAATPGDYTVNVQVGVSGGSADLTVATPLAAPTGLESTDTTETSVDLTWNAVTDADRYQVQYRQDGTADWLDGPQVNTTTATVGGLASGTTYDFRVVAQDSTGAMADSPPSAVVQATTGTPLPQLASPDNIATAGTTTTSIDVGWDARTGAVGYVVRYREDGTTGWTQLPETTDTAQAVTGLTAGTVYEYQVQAVGDGTTNTSSDWGPATPVAQTTATADLAAPANLFTEAVTTTSAGADWDAVADAAAYRVQYKLSADTDWTTWSPDPTGTSVTLTGLTADESYDIRVRAVGDQAANGDSPYTDAQTVNTTQLAVPEGFAVTGTTDTSITVTWDTVTDATGYGLGITQTGTTDWTDETEPAPPHTFDGLTASTDYDMRVAARADAWVDSDWSALVTDSTAPPALAVPTGLTTSNPQTDSVDLAWDPVTDTTAYHVQYKLTADTDWTDWSPDPTAETVTVTGLTGASSYDFRVRAVGDGTNFSDSDYTDPVTESTA